MDAQELAQRLRTAEEGARIELPAGRIEGTFVLPRAVTLVGQGASETVIDGKGRGAVFSVDAVGTPVRLEGMTITGGRSRAGGGLSIDNGAQVSLRRVRLEDNRAASGRGGAINLDRGRIALERCELVMNRAIEGGAIFVGGDAEGALHECWLAQNSAERGGALGITGGARVRLEACRLEENQAARKAHHLYTWGSSASRPQIELVKVAFGDVRSEGASIVNESDFKAEFTLEHTTWPSDSEKPAAKRVRRKFTLH